MDIIRSEHIFKKLEEGLIICGSARSGTTIMGKLVHSLQGVEYFFEPPMIIPLLIQKESMSEKSFQVLYEYYMYDQLFLESIAGRAINTNKSDDSSIYKVKSNKEIAERIEKSIGHVDLQDKANKNFFAYKMPEVVFFIKELLNIYKKCKVIIMHRNSNDVINSLLSKGWFSDASLNSNDKSEIFPTSIVNNVKVPFWVEECKLDFWINSSEINRCAYYVLKILESVNSNKNKAVIVDYDKFVCKPEYTMSQIISKFGMKPGCKTNEILSVIKLQKKQRCKLMNRINCELFERIIDLEKVAERSAINR